MSKFFVKIKNENYKPKITTRGFYLNGEKYLISL